MQFELIHTERMQLRKITPETYDYIFEHFTKPEQLQFLALNSSEALAQEYDKYKRGLSTYKQSFLFFQLIDPKTKLIFGECGFYTWYPDHARAEIGYKIVVEKYLRKGLMSEAIRAVLHYGFTQMNLHRVEAIIGPENIPSLKLAGKMNFAKEGYLKEHYFTNNRFEDSVLYALLKTDFKF